MAIIVAHIFHVQFNVGGGHIHMQIVCVCACICDNGHSFKI